jgi:hypothetical protein
MLALKIALIAGLGWTLGLLAGAAIAFVFKHACRLALCFVRR